MTESPPDMSGFRMETINEGAPPREAKPRRAVSRWGNPWVQASLILVAIVAALVTGALAALIIWG